MAKALYDTTQASFANLLEQAPIIPGATVSKPLLNDPALRLVLFAMDEGQRISEHCAPFIATVHVLQGRLRFTVEGQTKEIGPQDWVVMPPNAPHDLDALEPTRFLLSLAKAAM